jgi:cytochrome P450 family 26 subfamily A
MGMTNTLWFGMFRKGRQILSSFFGPIVLQSFVPRMHETIKAHFEQFWEKKDEITAGTLLKKITLSLAIDLFISIKEGPEFDALAHDMNTYLGGFFALPLNFLGTTYHKAMLAHEKMLHTLDIIIRKKQKASEFVLQIFLLSCINLSLFPKVFITFTIRCFE